jgi:cytochrome c-type biogenesis protein CcmH/NrfG
MPSLAETNARRGESGLLSNTVYGLAATCVAVGLLIGYFLLGNKVKPNVTSGAGSPSAAATYSGGHPKLTLEQMKQMADVQASTLVEKSKVDPKNAALLVEIASVYQSSHQFKEAAEYFRKSLKLDPRNVGARTQLASCLYYSDNIDGALAELNQALKYDPKDANALFNLGMIKYRGKKDNKGAIAAWQQLLKSNPNLDRKPVVEQLIAEAKTAAEIKN